MTTTATDNIANWTCDRCTWVNLDQDLACNMCFITRSSAKDLPYQWEWQPNPDLWIPFDKLSSAELEDAFQKRLPRIALCKGFFSDAPDHYILHMDYQARKFEQENLNTRNRRKVRRIANDDNSILIPVSDFGENNTCSICLDDFVGGDPAMESIRLPPCAPGHYFHRSCIAAAIKLRDTCPLCAKRIEY